MVKGLTKPFATALLAFCLILAAAVAGFIASVSEEAFADETAKPSVRESLFLEECDNAEDENAAAMLAADTENAELKGDSYSEIKWQYSRDNANWTDIDKDTVFNYDGNEWYIRAAYLKADDSYGYIPVENLLDAGTFTRTIDASEYDDYNFNADDLQITLKVEPQKVNLSSRNTFGFELASHKTELWDGPVYIYVTDEGERYPSYSLLDTENDALYQGWRFNETVSVTYSVARYRGVIPLTIGVKAYDKEKFNCEIDETSQHTANAAGVYMVRATLTAADNYAFESVFTSDIYSRGLTFDISPDKKTAVVTKVWYVVQVDNYLVQASDSEEEYDIPGWTYGAGINVSAPSLAVGNDVKTISYTLSSGNQTIAKFYSDEFEYYINSSMFVGEYKLEATIPAMTVGGIVYGGAKFVYEFEVEAVNIDLMSVPDKETGYDSYEWEYNAANRELFFKQFSYDISRAESLSFNHAEHKGYWKDLSDNDHNYTGYTITYNFARMYNDNYYAADNTELLNKIEAGTNATYTVYFNIEDRNHKPLTSMGDGRYDYFFTVTVYQTLAAPTVGNVTYTGEKVLPVITGSASELYEVIWSADDEYITGGEHGVSFRLIDPVHFRWADTEGDTATVMFNIDRANNEWVRVPNIVVWQFESFDTRVNRIRAVVKYLDDGNNVTFSVTKADGTAIGGLTGFTVNDDGTITGNDALVNALNALKFGEYKLNVTVESTQNYNALEQSIDFRISKANNSWADGDEDLVLPSWVVGNYNDKDNAIVINAAHGQVNIKVEDIDGNLYYNSVEGIDNLNALGVGKYLVKAWVDETDDYTALAERAFTIEVLKKVGLPWWGTLLIAAGALLVAALIIFILWKKGVFQILTGKIVLAIRTRASVEATIASVRAAKMMEEGRKSVEDAKRRERIEQLRKKAQEARAMAPEERAAALEAKAQAQAEKAEKIRARSESMLAKAEKIRTTDRSDNPEKDEKEPTQPEAEKQAAVSGPTQPEAEKEAAVTEQEQSGTKGNDTATTEE